ncbi:MAG TPA: hypothetical protein VLH15_08820, partial [Dehalococcoidales bacterium]|nr:hypothetical protein [Dehalococcoidales bacterium]
MSLHTRMFLTISVIFVLIMALITILYVVLIGQNTAYLITSLLISGGILILINYFALRIMVL